jgi:hypothetical protein
MTARTTTMVLAIDLHIGYFHGASARAAGGDFIVVEMLIVRSVRTVLGNCGLGCHYGETGKNVGVVASIGNLFGGRLPPLEEARQKMSHSCSSAAVRYKRLPRRPPAQLPRD